MLFTIIGLIVIAIVIYWLVKENQKCKAEKNEKAKKTEQVKQAEVKPSNQADTLMKVDKFAVIGSCSQNSCSIRRH
jgi:large-conductance mechanosensitive channel